MELVSVIIPTFNSSGTIKNSLESIITQSYENIEIIISDDASTDDTIAIAQNYLRGHNKSCKVLVAERNEGPSASRNKASKLANGSWLQFLDSDDILMPDKIKGEMSIAITAPKDVVVVYSPWDWGFYDNKSLNWLGPVKRPYFSNEHQIMCLVGGCRPLLGSSLVRRTAMDRIGWFNEQLRFWECEEVNVKLAGKGTFLQSAMNKPQYLWRLPKRQVYIGGSEARYDSEAVAFGWIKQALTAAAGRKLKELGLSSKDCSLLKKECTTWGRLVYSQHRAAFSDYLYLARQLEPDFLPAYPWYISAISQWIGYEGAEATARVTRKPKNWARTALCWANLRAPNPIFELQ